MSQNEQNVRPRKSIDPFDPTEPCPEINRGPHGRTRSSLLTQIAWSLTQTHGPEEARLLFHEIIDEFGW